MAWASTTNHANNQRGTVSTGTMTVTLAAVSANDRIEVVANTETNVGTTVTVVNDNVNAGNYSEDSFVTTTDGSFNIRHSVFSKNSGSGTPTVSVHGNSTDTIGWAGSMDAQTYTGLDTSASPVDVAVSASGSGGAPASGNTAATTAANELVLGGYSDDGANVTPTAGTGFTRRDFTPANGNAQAMVEDKDSGSSGVAQSAAEGATITVRWTISCVVYKLASVAATDPCVSYRAAMPAIVPMLQSPTGFVSSLVTSLIGTDLPRAVPSMPVLLPRPVASPDYVANLAAYMPPPIAAPPIHALYPDLLPRIPVAIDFVRGASVLLIGADPPVHGRSTWPDVIARLPVTYGWVVGSTVYIPLPVLLGVYEVGGNPMYNRLQRAMGFPG